MAILAAGVGFSVRGGILGQWAEQFGFTMTELGTITGGGLTGFGIVIIITSLFADKIGYGKLMVAAFLLHFVSAVLTLATPAFYASGGKSAAYWCLFSAMFIFAIGNGVCEAVVNPLVATLFPKEKTHYLNILHAGWPAGLVLGGLASTFMSASTDAAGKVLSPAVDWKIQMSLFLIPVVFYGAMLLGQKFPKSEAASAGITLGQMIGTIAAPLMLVLLALHALVGYVELGTDSWISKITGSIMASPANGLKLFVYTSLLMFVLRFVAGPIVHRISPLGLLCVSGVLGAIGLTMLGGAQGALPCASSPPPSTPSARPSSGPPCSPSSPNASPRAAPSPSASWAAVGMLSAGLLGGPAIGYKQDYFASKDLETKSPEAYARYAVAEPKGFLFLPAIKGLDGAKVGVLGDGGKELANVGAALAKDNKKDANHAALATWWNRQDHRRRRRPPGHRRHARRRSHGPQGHRRRPGHNGDPLPRPDPLLPRHRRIQGPQRRRGKSPRALALIGPIHPPDPATRAGTACLAPRTPGRAGSIPKCQGAATTAAPFFFHSLPLPRNPRVANRAGPEAHEGRIPKLPWSRRLGSGLERSWLSRLPGRGCGGGGPGHAHDLHNPGISTASPFASSHLRCSSFRGLPRPALRGKPARHGDRSLEWVPPDQGQPTRNAEERRPPLCSPLGLRGLRGERTPSAATRGSAPPLPASHIPFPPAPPLTSPAASPAPAATRCPGCSAPAGRRE
jgi:MFS family permease